MKIDILNRHIDLKECYGCSACAQICSKQAIKMLENDEGFLYPHLTSALCVECGLCIKVCPLNERKTPEKDYLAKVYAIKYQSDSVRFESTSGGAFTALYEYILSKQGVVYGAVWGEDRTLKVIHDRAESYIGCDKMRKSKYIQSDLKNTFRQVKQDLKDNKLVLFTGTPCQVAGLRSFLGEWVNKKIILVDLICHAVPSPRVWRDYIEHIEKVHGKHVVDYVFRSKEKGWRVNRNKYILDNHKSYSKNKLSFVFSELFYMHVICRNSCYKCTFASLPHTVSDITIADYWNIHNVNPAFDDNKGVSLVIINSKKGNDFFEFIKVKVDYVESNLQDAIHCNHTEPIKRTFLRNAFWKDYNQYGYLFVIQKYAHYTWCGKISFFFKRCIRELISVNRMKYVRKLLKK